MELKYLSTFRTVVEAGGFSRAAEKLGYTQSTITFQMGQLEQELGVRLFEKIGRKMALTQAGREMLPYVDGVLESVEKLGCFSETLGECRGELRVGVAETQLCYRLPPILKVFHARAPQAKLYLWSMNCYDIRDDLLSGKLDLGVFYGDVGGFGGSLVSKELGRFPLTLVASPETAARFPDFVTEGQKIPVPFVINEQNCVFRQIFEGYLREKAISLDHTMEMWSIPTIKNLVASDVGVSYLPRFTVEEELRAGTLAEIPTGLSGREITAVCAWHKNKWLSPLMELFLELCG